MVRGGQTNVSSEGMSYGQRWTNRRLVWGHELWSEVDKPTFYCCTALLVRTFSFFFHKEL